MSSSSRSEDARSLDSVNNYDERNFEGQSSENDFAKMDYSFHFSTNEKWSDRNIMIDWAREVGQRMNMVIIIKKSWARKVILSCEKSGSYRPSIKKVTEGPEKATKIRTKKSECPFELHGVLSKGSVGQVTTWKLTIICGSHNHDLPDCLHGHAFARRLTKEQRHNVKIGPSASTNPKLTVMQYTMDFLKHRGYYAFAERVIGTDVMDDLFISHPDARHLLSLFPHVIIMNTTYDTNRYGMPLLEIVGFSCTHLTFCIAIVFMKRETFGHYRRALQRLKFLLGKNEPKVIVTDREMYISKALEDVFPSVRHMLCWVHIIHNIEGYGLTKLPTKEDVDHFTGGCRWLFESTTEEMYEERLAHMRGRWKKLMNYVEDEWLKSYKESIVRAWTDVCLHLYTRPSNRDESHQSMIRNIIQPSFGGFDTIVGYIDIMFRDQVHEVRVAMERAREMTPNEIENGPEWVKSLFQCLKHKVSTECLKTLLKLAEEVKAGVHEEECCDTWWRDCQGLPCPHTIKKYIDQGIPIMPSEIHVFWKQVVWEGVGDENDEEDEEGDDEEEDEVDVKMRSMFNEIKNGEMHPDLLRDILSIYKDYRSPRTSTLQEPPSGEIMKGMRSKKV